MFLGDISTSFPNELIQDRTPNFPQDAWPRQQAQRSWVESLPNSLVQCMGCPLKRTS